MKKRQIIILSITVLIIAIGYGGCSLLAGMKTAPERKADVSTKRLVNALVVKNDTLVIKVPLQGKLVAQQRIEVFPEVTGTLLAGSKPFKVGQIFEQGEVLLALDGRESLLALKSQRSAFIALLSQVLPDIKIDYPSEFAEWEAYHRAIDPEKTLPELPEVGNAKLKGFLSGRNVIQQFYSIRSAENRQAKFTITAPYRGTISSGNANAGTVLRAGQKVGEFIRENNLELEAAIPVADAASVSIGDAILLTDPATGKSFNATISRLSSSVDANNQRITLFASIAQEGLKEGIYLEGIIETLSINNAISINRNLVNPEGYVYVVLDSVLGKKAVVVNDYYQENALITGLEDGDVILNQVIEGAFDGMPVKPVIK